jgi:HK97 family phage portal protein
MPTAAGPIYTPGRQKVRNSTNGTINLSDINDFFNNNPGAGMGGDLSVMTYFVCIRVLSEAVGKLDIRLMDKNNQEVTDHEAVYFLKVRPNQSMTPSFFKKMLEVFRNHYGNSYAYIARDRTGHMTGLYPMVSQSMQIYINNSMPFINRSYVYFYVDPQNGQQWWIDPEDVLHFKGSMPDNVSNGLVGKSAREILASSLAGEKYAQEFLNDLYQRGLTANAIIHYTGDLDEVKRKNLVKNILSFGAKATDKIIPLPLGMTIEPLNLKLTDSQFYELKNFNALQIAAAFGVKPDQLNIYDKSSYDNSEMQQLAFLVDTLAYILKGYEEELNYKLLSPAELQQGLSFRFNTWDLLRGDIETMQTVLSGYVNNGIYSPNEAREALEKPPKQGADDLYINGAYVPMGMAATANMAANNTKNRR